MNEQQFQQQMIVKALTKIDEAMAILKEITQGVETTKREIYEITKYESGSGNTTWKADCEDGERVYFRQNQKAMYMEVGIWDWLNDLDWDSTIGVKIEVETIPDGNFSKIVAVNSWNKAL